jgi:flagellar assembly factor FliW
MAQISSRSSLVEVKAQPNVYTIMLIVSILMLAITIGWVLYNLRSPVILNGQPGGYGMQFGDLFKPSQGTLP